MLDRKDIKAIAKARLKDAQVLLRGNRYEGAIYLCGYAWPAAGLVDTILRSFRLSFELHRTEIPQCGVPPTGIVKPLNVIEHIGFRLVSCVIQRPRGTFGL